MPRPKNKAPAPKSRKLIQAEIDGVAALHSWLGAKPGRATYLAKRTGINTASISRMKHGFTPITLEAAILIELGTAHALRAEQLCPSMAMLIRMFREQAATDEDGPLPQVMR